MLLVQMVLEQQLLYLVPLKRHWLTQCNEGTGEAEEAMVTIQGIICGVKLPPFKTWSRHLPTTPIVFQISDLVELQTSLICIPNKRNFTVKLFLRSMILLNGKLTMQATTVRMLMSPAATPVLRHLKHCNPYTININTDTCKSHGSFPYPRIDTNNNNKGTSVAIDAHANDTGNAHIDNKGRDECMDT
ncbi:hypothetical protein BDN71DRAFT_1436304 [Pleurotus eryngii]|uniref:Uncharacterized protein n=1 Tax=Pleurotus eryngii TaxID=5323 RepID=A0A9P5ZH69_PLEER|nr:hypothetical protein BDN71DRAFT_1436304 [Pleurotus eryngii]